MKILILANNAAGLYHFRGELVERLALSHEVVFCVPDNIFVADLESLNARFVPCPLLKRRGKNPIQDIKLRSFYKKLLKVERPDVVFTYTIKPNVYGGMACASAGVPYLANVTGLGTAVENGGLMQKLTLTLYRRGLKKAQKVFFQNSSNRNFMLEKNVLTAPSDLLPGSGVNLAAFERTDCPNRSITKFVFIGRIMGDKGVGHFLDVAKLLHPDNPNVEFHIYGVLEPDYGNDLNSAVDSGCVIYHGFTKNMREVYEDADCIVLPSYHEGLSNVLLEAAACGRPAITTDVPGCREVVEDGKNGYLTVPKSSEDLLKQMNKFLELDYGERSEMGRYARLKVEKEFDRNIIVNTYMKEVERIASK